MGSKLTIVAVTYSGHTLSQIRNFISSLYCQTNQFDWKCDIYYDVTEECIDIKPHYNLDDFGIDYGYSTLSGKSYDKRINLIKVNPPKGSYGNYNRLDGLNKCESEWVTFNNIDNQIFPVFVQTALDHCNDCDILAWPVVHNYANGRFYEVLQPKPNVGDIDYCSFMIKTELAKSIGFNAIDWSGQDGLLVQQAVASGARFKTINAVLACHN